MSKAAGRPEGRPNSTATAVGRPRDPAVDKRALRAARDLLAERGYAAITFDEVARRAGVGKSSLYRRWPSKAELVVAAVDAGVGDVTDIDTGTLRSDLRELAARLLEAYWSGAGLAAFRLRADARHEPELQRAIDAVQYKDSVRQSRTIIRRGLRRGELPDHVSPTLIGDLVVGSILVHVMATPVHLTDTVRRRSAEYLDILIDTILAGAATVPDS